MIKTNELELIASRKTNIEKKEQKKNTKQMTNDDDTLTC